MSQQIAVQAMAIIENSGRILAHKSFDRVKNQEFFKIPGGHIEFGETAEAAIRRNFLEKFESPLLNLQFLGAVENIFTFNGTPGHEVIFLFKAELERNYLYTQEKIVSAEGKEPLEATWLFISEVTSGKLILYPTYDFSQFL